jgi:hypothetical protein
MGNPEHDLKLLTSPEWLRSFLLLSGAASSILARGTRLQTGITRKIDSLLSVTAPIAP